MDNKMLFIANLPVDANESNVRGAYDKYGHIVSCFIVRARGTDRSRGIGFVEFERHDQAEAAISETNGMKFWENIIRVQWAKPLSQEEKERKARLSQRKQSQDMMNSGPMPMPPFQNNPPNPRDLYRMDSRGDNIRDMRDIRDLRDMRDIHHDSRDLRDLRDLRERDMRERDMRDRDLRNTIRDMRDMHHDSQRMMDDRMINDYRMESKYEPKMMLDDKKNMMSLSQRSPPPMIPPQSLTPRPPSPIQSSSMPVPPPPQIIQPQQQQQQQVHEPPPPPPKRPISTRLFDTKVNSSDNNNTQSIPDFITQMKAREQLLEEILGKPSGRNIEQLI